MTTIAIAVCSLFVGIGVACYLRARYMARKAKRTVADLIDARAVPESFSIMEYPFSFNVVANYTRPISGRPCYAVVKPFLIKDYYFDRDFAKREAEELLAKLNEN